MASKLVLGFTGPTRCGKGRIVKMVADMLEDERGWSVSAGQIQVIEQDGFWRRCVTVVLPDGKTLNSEEEAECHDFDAFHTAIQTAIAKKDVNIVIIDGFTIIHDPRVAQCCDHIFMLNVNRENTVLRRSAADAHNQNPLSVSVCESVVWPAHERYLKRADDVLAHVGKSWIVLDANDNGLEMLDSHVKARAESVYKICFPDVTSSEYQYLESRMNGLVLDIDMAVETPGAKLCMWGKEGGKNQRWKLSSSGYLESALNGLVLTIKDGELVMWPWEHGSNQRWRFTDDGYLESHLGPVLDIDEAVNRPGAKLVVWEKLGAPNQKWRWT